MKINNLIIIPEIEEKLAWKHGILRYEVEEAFENKPLFRFEQKGKIPEENIYSAMSKTDSGRYIAMFFIYKKNNDALVISARDMTKKERQYYVKQKRKF